MALKLAKLPFKNQSNQAEKIKMELYELLEKIRKRPALYLGKRSLSHLQVFLDGYTFARRQSGISPSQQEEEFGLFQEWVEQRFNQAHTQSWTKIILFYSEDESSALQRFFELLDEFRLHQQMSAKEKIQI